MELMELVDQPPKNETSLKPLVPSPDDFNAQYTAKDYQVCIKILEARQLEGLELNPCVHIQVGEEKKKTQVKKCTSSPYFDEYFVFEFSMPASRFFDQVITLTVKSEKFFRAPILGVFKIDVATVYSEEGHFFFNKWALLLDPKDPQGGAKGYLKCDLIVHLKGETIRLPPNKPEDDDEDPEENILLPEGAIQDRTPANYTFTFYFGQDIVEFPEFDIALNPIQKKPNQKARISPYIRVVLAGLVGETSHRSHSPNPSFNEKITFLHMFPALVRRIKIQLRDHLSGHVIATHFLDLATISNDSKSGFTPTFGPAFVNFYGGLATDLHPQWDILNFGMGEGAMFRGRIFFTFDVKPIETVASRSMFLSKFFKKKQGSKQALVKKQPLKRDEFITEADLRKNEEFFLFACVFEANLIDRKYANEKLHLEISIGKDGNMADGYRPIELEESYFNDESMSLGSLLSRANSKMDLFQNFRSLNRAPSEDEISLAEEELANLSDIHMSWRSQTPPRIPTMTDECHCALQFFEDKPCLFIRGNWYNDIRREQQSNSLRHFTKAAEKSLNIADEMRRCKISIGARDNLRCCLNTLAMACRFYVNYCVRTIDNGELERAGGNDKRQMFEMTDLDLNRSKCLKDEFNILSEKITDMSQALELSNLDVTMDEAERILGILKSFIVRAQMSLPDVFLWLMSGTTRIAYHRIPMWKILHSNTLEERGDSCGKISRVFLTVPPSSANNDVIELWEPQAEVNIYCWLGPSAESGTKKEGYTSGIPKGYRDWHIPKKRQPFNASSDSFNLMLPPRILHYFDSAIFELRCHFYMAKDLIGSDESGLSDPFVRVVFSGNSGSSQAIDQTVNPVWDETLVFPGVLLYGTPKQVQESPPMLTVQVFDQDILGQNEPIGVFEAIPVLKLADEKYDKPKYPPKLEWYFVTHLGEPAGQVLAVFELFELTGECDDDCYYPPLPDVVETSKGPKIPLPMGIRPRLTSHYAEILFWGVRDLKPLSQFSHNLNPKIEIEMAGQIIESDVIEDYNGFPNFTKNRKVFEIEMPEDPQFRPPVTIRCLDCKSFGRTVLLGSHTVTNFEQVFYEAPLELKELLIQVSDDEKDDDFMSQFSKMSKMSMATTVIKKVAERMRRVKKNSESDEEEEKTTEKGLELMSFGNKIEIPTAEVPKKKKLDNANADFDWWTKYSFTVAKISEELTKQQQARKALSKKDMFKKRLVENALFNKAKTAFVDVHSQALNVIQSNDDEDEIEEIDEIDTDSPKSKNERTLELYSCELENIKEMESFEDIFQTFTLSRGKKVYGEEDSSRFAGVFKGSLKICPYPLPKDIAARGFFKKVPRNDQLEKVLVRVYTVKAIGLNPTDPNGKADPYVVVSLGSTVFNDVKNHHNCTLNPIFGGVFEIVCEIPQATQLNVQVFDWDRLGSDELIGETQIDIENRYYSKHRGTCGLSKEYDTSGYNEWRDCMKPSVLLDKLCKEYDLTAPVKDPTNRLILTIGETVFMRPDPDNKLESEDINLSHARNCLYVLNHWNQVPTVGCKLAPEHVETRALYNPEKPGIEQGRLEMWVDIFPMELNPGPPVEIKPKKPEEYELRVTIYDTKEVPLNDYSILEGSRSSDIYIKGFITGPEASQSTDVHYRSLNGEGNFNWRFIFKFKYLPTEQKILIKKKETMFAISEMEVRFPARLTLQVWDADTFTGDDMLGLMELDMNKLPRGKKLARNCNADMVDPKIRGPTISIFKKKRMRGWWPFTARQKDGKMKMAGKVDMELELVTEEDAKSKPVGVAREEPNPMPAPQRPETSFAWFMNPLKVLKYTIWEGMKYKILIAFLILLAICFFGVFIYNLPNYAAMKIWQGKK